MTVPSSLDPAACFSVVQAAIDHPDGIAVVTPTGEITWSELASRVVDLRRQLDGTWPGWRLERIGLLGRRDLPSLLRLYLLLEEEVAFLSLHPRLTVAERQRLCSRFALDSVWQGPLEEGESLAQSASREDRARSVPAPKIPEGTMAVLFTSGTSGEPKGAILSRSAMLASAEASARNLSWHDDDRWLLSLPIAHVGGLSIVTRSLAARCAVVLQEELPFAPDALFETVLAKRVTLLSVVPTMLKRLLDWCDANGRDCPSSLRAVLVGGAAASEALIERAVAQGWPVLVTYGLTEACSQVATQDYHRRFQSQAGVGTVVEGLELRLAGRETNDPRGVGRILLRGASLFDGYLGQPSPFDAEGFFDTGDSGFVDASGALHVVGRRSDLIVTGGENVYPVEVEAVLESHPAVLAAVVFGVADEEWGEQVAAALVAVEQPLTDDELRRYLQGRLAGYKRPRRVTWLEELPLNRSFKVDRERSAILAAERSRTL